MGIFSAGIAVKLDHETKQNQPLEQLIIRKL